jgi:hypothetical protein
MELQISRHSILKARLQDYLTSTLTYLDRVQFRRNLKQMTMPQKVMPKLFDLLKQVVIGHRRLQVIYLRIRVRVKVGLELGLEVG